eukprot:6769495-Prymnesium_polylepis.2
MSEERTSLAYEVDGAWACCHARASARQPAGSCRRLCLRSDVLEMEQSARMTGCVLQGMLLARALRFASTRRRRPEARLRSACFSLRQRTA